MFDDLDPDFISSPGPALPLVAARVYAVRRRRMVVVGSVCGALVVALLGSMTFGGGGDPDRLTVAREATTTTSDDTSSNPELPLITVPTSSTSTSTSTTVAATSTTVTLPVGDTTTSSPETTTTEPAPAHFVVTFDRERLVIQSGTEAAISVTVTNDGGTRGTFGYFPDCAPYTVWPGEQSFTHPIGWPVPRAFPPICAALGLARVEPGESATVRVKVSTHVSTSSPAGNYVPIPPGHDTLVVENTQGDGEGRLPVTITAPASLPVTVDVPSEVTTASGAQHEVDFTITNHLPFPVVYILPGPCAHGGERDCVATYPQSARDLRVRPYDQADVPLYTTRFELGANETRTATAAVDGVIDLDDSGSGSPALPPGVYHFDWNGEKVKFTVT